MTPFQSPGLADDDDLGGFENRHVLPSLKKRAKIEFTVRRGKNTGYIFYEAATMCLQKFLQHSRMND